jgi:hypothetical protein
LNKEKKFWKILNIKLIFSGMILKNKTEK